MNTCFDKIITADSPKFQNPVKSVHFIQILSTVLTILPIMLELCWMLLLSYYAQYYAGIIGLSLRPAYFNGKTYVLVATYRSLMMFYAFQILPLYVAGSDKIPIIHQYTKIRLLQACHKQNCCKIITYLYLKLFHVCYICMCCMPVTELPQVRYIYIPIIYLLDSCYTKHRQPLYKVMTDLNNDCIIFNYHECHLQK